MRGSTHSPVTFLFTETAAPVISNLPITSPSEPGSLLHSHILSRFPSGRASGRAFSAAMWTRRQISSNAALVPWTSSGKIHIMTNKLRLQQKEVFNKANLGPQSVVVSTALGRKEVSYPDVRRVF